MSGENEHHPSARVVAHVAMLRRHGPTVLRDLGVMLHLPGVMAACSMPVAWLADERWLLQGLLLTAAVSLVTGQVLYRLGRGAIPMTLRQAMVTTVLCWALIPLVGALPFLVSMAAPAAGAGIADAGTDGWSSLDALFEAMSGFTSTGLTMVSDPSALPLTLQWWRSLMQWIGGVGIIVVTLTVFHPSGDAERLLFSEGHEDASRLDVASTVRSIWWVYPLYTVVAVCLLRLTGLDWWQSLNYGMTGIATGGFAVTAGSLRDFGPYPQLAMTFIMLAGAISFSVHYRMLATRRISVLWTTPENRALFALLVAGCLALAVENEWTRADATWLDSAFQLTSALTTAGFSTVEVGAWTPSAQLLLCAAMWCGGASGATSGGLKLKRVTLIASGAYERIHGVVMHPWRLMAHRPMADPRAARRTSPALEAATIMALLWGVGVLLGTVVLSHAAGPDVALDNVVLEVSSALGNVGLSSGVTSVELHWAGKVTLIGLMWLGRLEIVPALVLGAALIVSLRARVPRDEAGRG